MALLPEKGWSRERHSRVNLKKKRYKRPALTANKQVTYKGSTVIPTSSSLEMIQVLCWFFFFFQKIVINLLKWVLKLMAALNLVFSVFFSVGKIQHLTI